METLDAVVDRFVLCEAPFTFRGQPKPLVFAQNHERFARWRERIVHLVYAQPAQTNPWRNEWGQRDHLGAGIADLDDDALVLIGDCDESPIRQTSRGVRRRAAFSRTGSATPRAT